MIFVTVGTHKFDALIRCVDELLVASREKVDDVIFQIGSGEYIPKSGEYFRYLPSLIEHLERASLVITHGGTGSVLPLTRMAKPFVAVVNDDLADNHQREFLKILSERSAIVWYEGPDAISSLDDILQAKSVSFADFKFDSLSDDLNGFLSSC